MNLKNKFCLSLFLCLVFYGSAEASPFSDQLLAPNALQPTSGVNDVSDRNYYAKVKQLVGFARSEIDVALDLISVSDLPSDPIRVLVNDLINAAKRGARVRVFLNTSSSEAMESTIFLRSDLLAMLHDHGVNVHFVNPEYTLRDRLVMIDQKIVIEGGPPWVHQDMEESLASATVIYSSDLAFAKKKRLDMLPLWDVAMKKEDRNGLRVSVPLFLLKEVRYFPNMASFEDGDAMRIFLALLQKFYEAQNLSFKVSLNELTGELPADRIYDKGSVAFQVLRTLQRLESEYELLEIVSELPDELEIKLLFPKDIRPVIGIHRDLFAEGYTKELSAKAIYAYLVIAYHMQISGESPVWLGTEQNVEQDFPLKAYDFRLGVAELRNLNLIEVFPFSLNQGNVVVNPSQKERRYVMNPIATLSERLETWKRFREQFDDEPFRKARELAEIFGESEDPRVIRVFMELIEHYSLDHVYAFTKHVSELPPQSTAAQLDYLSNLLKHEIQENVQLATY